MSDNPTSNLQWSNIPNPDPSVITDREIAKAKTDLRREFEMALEGLKTAVFTRIEAMDRASTLFAENLDRATALLDREVATIKGWTIERFSGMEGTIDQKFNGLTIKFESIATQFAERDKRTEQLSLADKTAIAAALQAQKEDAAAKNDSNATATTKMEANFSKQIDQTQQLLQEMRRSTDDKINDIKSRLDKGEGSLAGGADTRSEHRLNIGSVMGVIGAVIGVLALLWGVVQAVQVGSNSKAISAMTESSHPGVPPGYMLVPAPATR